METKNQARRIDWQTLVTKYETSSCSKAAYCREHQLNYHRFLYWYERFKNTETSLVPVRMAGPTRRDADLCSIVLANGHRIIIHDTSLLPMLKQLISMVS